MNKPLIVFLLIAGVAAGSAKQRIDSGTNIGLGNVKIAVPDFQPVSADSKTSSRAGLFNQVLRDDLTYSGGVTVVNSSYYPAGNFGGPADIKPEDWTNPVIGAEFIAFGNLRAGGPLSVEARLWDLKGPAAGREIRGLRYPAETDSEPDVRLTAHKFADAIIDAIGGAKGIAQTRIAFISERPLGTKDLYVMDYDGYDPQPVTAYNSLVLTPSWSPDGEKIAVTSFRRGAPDIEVLSRIDHRPYAFERVGGNTFTPAWSPDGSKIAFATSRDGGSTQIYSSDWNGKSLHRLTTGAGSNNSPVWNPKTGRQIAFISDRSGAPRLYIMDADGTNVRKVFDDGGYVDEPAWSPDGARIAFAWRKSRTSDFDIYIYELGTGDTVQITHDAGSNERPTWAPDGRHLAFQSSRNGEVQIFSTLADGNGLRQLTMTGKNTAPAWSGLAK